MRQKTDLPFQEILKKARDGRLGTRDIEALNRRLAIKFPTIGVMDIVIIVQKKRLITLSIAYKLKYLHVQIIGKLFFF